MSTKNKLSKHYKAAKKLLRLSTECSTQRFNTNNQSTRNLLSNNPSTSNVDAESGNKASDLTSESSDSTRGPIEGPTYSTSYSSDSENESDCSFCSTNSNIEQVTCPNYDYDKARCKVITTEATTFSSYNVEANALDQLNSASGILDCNSSGLQPQLSEWCLNFNISHIAINNLLTILKPHHPDLPLDSRTLLQTPRQCAVAKHIESGEYFHFGLKNCIVTLLSQFPNRHTFKVIEILINIDGLPLSKSSGSQFYPILACLYENKNVVDIIGCYHGYKKPNDCNMFLSDFVNESIELLQNEFVYENQSYEIKIKGFICDAPAKSFVKYIKGHSGYMSCTKCHSEGTYNDGICFPEISNLRSRSDLDFREKLQEEHHLGTSYIERIPGVDMIKSFPLDYMHLICLGVVKKLIVSLWSCGKPGAKLSFKNLTEISTCLEQQIGNIPVEFNRKPRSITECKRWKATEFRQFLLYTGPVILKHHLSSDKYNNFLALHIAVTILSSRNHSKYIDFAERLLHYFVETFIILYGVKYLSHNVHNLLHITDDVRIFGHLDRFSAFQFENYMQVLKKHIRKHDKPLQQLINRRKELENVRISNKNEPRSFPYCTKAHFNGPVLPGKPTVTQYKEAVFTNFVLKVREPDNICYLKNGSVISICNFILTDENQIMIIGFEFLKKENFYECYADSSELNIFLLHNEISALQMWSIDDVCVKGLKLSFSENFVAYPLVSH